MYVWLIGVITLPVLGGSERHHVLAEAGRAQYPEWCMYQGKRVEEHGLGCPRSAIHSVFMSSEHHFFFKKKISPKLHACGCDNP